MALCTRAEVKAYLTLTDSETQQDSLIDSLILAAQGFIEEYCNRTFEKSAVTEYHKGGSNRIFLKRPPIDTVQTLQVWDSWDRTYLSDDLIDSDDYYVEVDTGIVYFDYEIGGVSGSIKVAYTGGFAVIPPAISQACVELVARKTKEGPSGALGVPTRTIPEGGSVSFVIDALLPQTKIALDLYRLG
jgi:hypothetical protein